MSDKKHIDRLFQESFKDFEATPENNVWKNIESTLENKKKSRRVIPIWWKLTGVAAALLLLFTVGNTIYNFNNSNTSEEILVDAEIDSLKNSENNSNFTNSNTDTSKNTDAIVSSSDSELKDPNSNFKNNSTSSETSNNSIKNITETLKDSKSINNTISALNKKKNVSKNNLNSISENTQNSTVITQTKNSENTITDTANSISKTSNSKLVKNTTSNNSKAISESTITNTEITKEADDINVMNTDSNSQLVKNTANNSSEGLTNTNNNGSETTIAEEETISNEVVALENIEKEDEEGKISLVDEVAETNKEEEIIEKEELKNRWNVMPNIAPVYFNTLGEGSSFDGQFNGNDKTGGVNMSYGIAASYKVSNKLSVRTGINRVNVGYNTNDVLIYDGLENSSSGDRPIKSINYNANSQNTVIISADDFAFSQVPNILSNTIDASLDQRLGFIEVPLELAYKVSDKKLGISVIGGVSALFLDNNEVFSTLNGNSTLLGEANNINETSFSANFGLGLDYKLSDKFDINLEPVFKYQMNTFEDTSGDFQPFIIGIYTGFSFKF